MQSARVETPVFKSKSEPDAAPEPQDLAPESASPLEALVIATINELRANGISTDEMAPLLRLKDVVKAVGLTERGAAAERRGAASSPSEQVLARACVVVDLLCHCGRSLDEAAQMMARQLMTSGVALPEHGGDARGWKRLLVWRTKLLDGRQSRAATEAYIRFKTDLSRIPAGERVEQAFGRRLWDRRSER